MGYRVTPVSAGFFGQARLEVNFYWKYAKPYPMRHPIRALWGINFIDTKN
jgi:hypothetical protein